MSSYKIYKQLNWAQLEEEILEIWDTEKTFEESISNRKNAPQYTFYEGPPSANGMPGIHHVMGRAIKDIFCRYKTQKGFMVNRKAGWDTHGLPVELQVEKRLGITKEDIGKSISVKDYNAECKKDVLKFKDTWDALTRRIGYWVDMDNPYITYDKNYIESVWYILKDFFDKGLLYKGHTIQPYSPAAGTGLSSHELGQPGAYQMVKDTTIVAQFKIKDTENDYFIAWTTTPWTLPSNTALAVGKKIDYVKIETFNPYTFKPINVYLAEAVIAKYFKADNANLNLEDYTPGDKEIPFKIIEKIKGADLEGLKYEQLMPYHQPEGKAFEVILGNFVNTEDGTGIVHIAPSFGQDDAKVAKENGIDVLTLVDKQGRFLDGMEEFSRLYVKNYNNEDESAKDYKSTDVLIAIKLKTDNKAFKVEKYEHSYPHCWRTDKPILYYPLESWFVKTTQYKDQLVELNNTINWKPKSTGTGRFGNWLENLVDWNLSRSRYWGTPLPIWRTENGEESICIGSIEQLSNEIDISIKKGYMKDNLCNQEDFDLHKPFVDDIILSSPSGLPMKRESDLIDVWFDSGAMPYAQWHYPFENKDKFEQNYPADFIAEGIDQTRGWFFTLHTISTLLNGKVAFKNVIANGLVQDKDGNKMSKRLGNTIDPFKTIEKYGVDAVRWYMVSNASPWDNLKFNLSGIDEVRRKFFGTLSNTYSFFALYANLDKFDYSAPNIPINKRSEIDQWILSTLQSLILEVTESFDDYNPTKAARAIQYFVLEQLSNWFVRLSRRRFWRGELNDDKISAYQTLYTCLMETSKLIAPISPFYADRLFKDLNAACGTENCKSVHISDFPVSDKSMINNDLERRMYMAQKISSLILSVRKKENLRVRQPLQKAIIPIFNEEDKQHLDLIKDLILSEVNIKEIEYISKDDKMLIKGIKPNFKLLGPKAGSKMKEISGAIFKMTQEEILILENEGIFNLTLSDKSQFELSKSEAEINYKGISGWEITTDGEFTIALDLTLTEKLKNEGYARDVVNRIQNLRKETGFEITDRIIVDIHCPDEIKLAIEGFNDYICGEILADTINLKDSNNTNFTLIEIEEFKLYVQITKK